MDDQRRREVALAILTVLAIVLAAVAAAPMFGDGSGDGDGSLPDTSDRAQAEGNTETTIPEQLWIALVGLVYTLWQIVVIVVLWILSFLNPIEPDPPEENTSARGVPIENRSEGRQESLNGSSDLTQGADTPYALPIDDPIVLVLFVATLLLVAVVAIRYDAIQSVVRLVGGGVRNESEEDLGGIGRVAGEAADRVEAADSPEAAENAIYHAWGEMVDLLGVSDPQSDTPRQFADAAIEAGMDPSDVSALTGAFEQVRYGGAAPSEERRREATEAFRRIEAEYREDDDSRSTETRDDDADREPEGAE